MDNRNQARWVHLLNFIQKSGILFHCAILSFVILNSIQCLVDRRLTRYPWINHKYLIDSSNREFGTPVLSLAKNECPAQARIGEGCGGLKWLVHNQTQISCSKRRSAECGVAWGSMPREMVYSTHDFQSLFLEKSGFNQVYTMWETTLSVSLESLVAWKQSQALLSKNKPWDAFKSLYVNAVKMRYVL